MNKKLCQDLKNELYISPVSKKDHIKETINKVNKEYKKHSSRERIGYFEFLLRQIPFAGRKIWIMQGGMLVIMCWLLNALGSEDLKYIVNSNIANILCFFAIITTLASIHFFSRSRKFRMYEIESATRGSIPKLILSHAILITMGNAITFAAIILVTIYQINISAAFATLYLILPFLISWCGCIFILNHSKKHKEKSYILCEGFCIALLFLQTAIHAVLPQIYKEANLSEWIIFTIIYTVILAVQLIKLMKKFTMIYSYSPSIS